MADAARDLFAAVPAQPAPKRRPALYADYLPAQPIPTPATPGPWTWAAERLLQFAIVAGFLGFPIAILLGQR